eukprot:Clim_evm63s128 gene=Clim_evmTU63s128
MANSRHPTPNRGDVGNNDTEAVEVGFNDVEDEAELEQMRQDEAARIEENSESEGEDLDENFDADENESQDDYEASAADAEEHSEMDIGDRRAVEEELARRDRRLGKRKKGPTKYFGGADSSDGEEEQIRDMERAERALATSRKVKRLKAGDYESTNIDRDLAPAQDPFAGTGGAFPSSAPSTDFDAPDLTHRDDDEEEDGDEDAQMQLNPHREPARDWIQRKEASKAIKKNLRSFLNSYDPEAEEGKTSTRRIPYYYQKLAEMASANGESLIVEYRHLINFNAVLGLFLVDAPTGFLELFDQVAMDVLLTLFPKYRNVHEQIHVRVRDLIHTEALRELRQSNLNELLQTSGVITRRSSVLPQLKQVYLDCQSCKEVLGPYMTSGQEELRIGNCPFCQQKGPFSTNQEKTLYSNYQTVTLQESPGSVPPGRLPRQKEVILKDDLVDCVKPGDEVVIVAVYSNNFDPHLNNRNGFPVFATVLEANYVEKREDQYMSHRLTDEDHREILELARHPRIGERIVKSIAPSIYGHEDIKLALALSLFGGVPKQGDGKHKVRGDINILMLGDPGTAKSQFLKYVEKTAPRAVFATGQGASAVGLTASVRKDINTREWTLDGGALVLADQGVCLIDEFDKMNDQDRTSIHEAMEQQGISISKAGIVTTLQARCAVIAAANPINGRYNPSLTFSQNVDLTDPIVSRFDILCVVRDTADEELDATLAKFVVDSHAKAHPEAKRQQDMRRQEAEQNGEKFEEEADVDPDIIPQDMLRKYIQYARQNVKPRSDLIDEDRMVKFYAELRQEAARTASVPVSVRHFEAILRISEAHAKMHLRDTVNMDDINQAIKVILESFMSTQKNSVRRDLRRSATLYRYVTYNQDVNQLLVYTLKRMLRKATTLNHQMGSNERPEVPISTFERNVKNELHVSNLQRFYDSDLLQKHDIVRDLTDGVFYRQSVEAMEE